MTIGFRVPLTLLAGVIAALGVSTWSPGTASAQSLRATIGQAWTYMEAGNLRKAEEAFSKAFETPEGKKSAEVHYGIAAVWWERRNAMAAYMWLSDAQKTAAATYDWDSGPDGEYDKRIDSRKRYVEKNFTVIKLRTPRVGKPLAPLADPLPIDPLLVEFTQRLADVVKEGIKAKVSVQWVLLPNGTFWVGDELLALDGGELDPARSDNWDLVRDAGKERRSYDLRSAAIEAGNSPAEERIAAARLAAAEADAESARRALADEKDREERLAAVERERAAEEARRAEQRRLEGEQRAAEEAKRLEEARVAAARFEEEQLAEEQRRNRAAAAAAAERRAEEEQARADAARMERERRAEDEQARADAARIERERRAEEEQARADAARIERERREAQEQAQADATRIEAEQREAEEAKAEAARMEMERRDAKEAREAERRAAEDERRAAAEERRRASEERRDRENAAADLEADERRAAIEAERRRRREEVGGRAGSEAEQLAARRVFVAGGGGGVSVARLDEGSSTTELQAAGHLEVGVVIPLPTAGFALPIGISYANLPVSGCSAMQVRSHVASLHVGPRIGVSIRERLWFALNVGFHVGAGGTWTSGSARSACAGASLEAEPDDIAYGVRLDDGESTGRVSFAQLGWQGYTLALGPQADVGILVAPGTSKVYFGISFFVRHDQLLALLRGGSDKTYFFRPEGGSGTELGSVTLGAVSGTASMTRFQFGIRGRMLF